MEEDQQEEEKKDDDKSGIMGGFWGISLRQRICGSMWSVWWPDG